jgi:hypothetical protein
MKNQSIQISKTVLTQGLTVTGSLIGYYASTEKDGVQRVPAILIGGFIGTLIGEIISQNENRG